MTVGELRAKIKGLPRWMLVHIDNGELNFRTPETSIKQPKLKHERVISLFCGGMRQIEIAAALGMSKQHVNNIIAEWRKSQ